MCTDKCPVGFRIDADNICIADCSIKKECSSC